MINEKSINTPYDEPLTLVEWLQKTTKALEESVLTNLGIAKLSDQDNVATYQVTATFADNTTIVSDTFTLPSTDIVTAFSNLTTLVNGFDSRITTNTNNVGSILDIIDIANDQINAYTLQNSINGSDDIIVDVDETNEKLEIHLSAELQAKLARVLLTPLSAPSTRKVVTIDTNGAQDNVDGTELITLMGNIVDSNGNKRFVEGDLFFGTTQEGVTTNYKKYSLSGTHLMLVLELEIDADTSFNAFNVTCTLPDYIKNKIVALDTTSQIVIPTRSYTGMVAGTWQQVSKLSSYLAKSTQGLTMVIAQDGTHTAKTIYRIQYDLLIDSE